ncbi:MAG: alpha/beta hydrolase [Pseudomonadota bacterium]
MTFFAGFEVETIDLHGWPQRVRRGGKGPALVLIHGNPQTHMMWNAIAPDLARDYTVYCPDLRGYGVSPKPPASKDSSAYSKRAMAQDLCDIMDHYGEKSFLLVGHDRGGRASHRLALDHPERVERLVVLDIIPTLEHFERTDMAFARAYAHWFYLAMPHPFPEDLINANPKHWFKHHCSRPMAPENGFHPEALADYLEHIQNTDVVRGICEDYRAAAGIDLEHDRASRAAGAKIQCPTLALWGEKGIIGKFYEPLAIWQLYCAQPVVGGSVKAGHYLPEENPAQVLGAIRQFLAA